MIAISQIATSLCDCNISHHNLECSKADSLTLPSLWSATMIYQIATLTYLRLISLSRNLFLLRSMICTANGALPLGTSAFGESTASSSSPATCLGQTLTFPCPNFLIWARIQVSFALLKSWWKTLRYDGKFIQIMPVLVLSLFTVPVVLFRDPPISIILL